MPWTEKDDLLLGQLAGAGVPIVLAANQMDRPYNTVLPHSKLLGLSWQAGTAARAQFRNLDWNP